MALYLKCINLVNKTEKRTKQINGGLVIGRGSAADIILNDDENISRLHPFVFPRQDNRLELRDLSSTSGTFVINKGNSNKLMPEQGKGGFAKGRAILIVGEKFTVGKYRIEVCSEDVLGESSWRRKFHEGLDEATREAEKEITEVDFDVDDY